MSGAEAALVRNDADCTCTNSVHSVRLREGIDASLLLDAWDSPLARLSCEIEGHPLGGGMLKLEPREASNIYIHTAKLSKRDTADVTSGIQAMREWRHHGTA
jgi:hypothetical protein